MKPMRLFIAINLPELIRTEITKLMRSIEPIFSFPVRFVASQNWHITITFLGATGAESMSGIITALEETINECEPPKIVFNRLCYGPLAREGKRVLPRMIWLMGSPETSMKLATLKQFLENRLHAYGVRFQHEDRLFETHLTLARFESSRRDAFPVIERACTIEFQGESIDLMESTLKRNAVEYETISSFDFTTQV